MKKIRVLHIGMSSNNGGIESYILNCYRHIDRNKFVFDFVNDNGTPLAYEKELIKYGSKIYNIPRGLQNYKLIKSSLKKIIEEEKYDFVHFHLMNYCSFFRILVALKCPNTKVIIHSHASGYHVSISPRLFLMHSIGKLLIKNKKIIRLACSSRAGKWMFDDKDYILMRNGIEYKKFAYNEKNRNKIRKKYDIKSTDILIGYVTNFSSQKNNSYLLSVFKYLHKINNNYKLILVGEDSKAVYEKKYVIDNNISSNVIFSGVVDNTDEIYSAMDLYICPSLVEGFSISLIEVAANGLQCYISNKIANYQYPGKNRFHEINVDESPNKIAEYINKSYQTIENNRKKIDFVQEYDICNCAKDLSSFYVKNHQYDQYIVAFDPSCGTENLGDHIISSCIESEMDFLFDEAFMIHYSTHTPISKWYQNFFKGPVRKIMKKSNYKFIFGTNIIKNTLFTRHPDFNVDLIDSRLYRDAITIGCGSDINSSKMDEYTKHIYKKILSKDYYHSVRDERTKSVLESLGLKAINTGCPTLWGITKNVCSKIPIVKSDSVVFTLTCYITDPVADQQLIDILNNNYKNVYFFPQGFDDLNYFNSLKNTQNIIVIQPNLKSFEKVLRKDVDYIGTRLHAGIFALRHQVRSIIIIVDNRARDMAQDNNLVCVERSSLNNSLDKLINSRFSTNININQKNIDKWKSQFKQ